MSTEINASISWEKAGLGVRALVLGHNYFKLYNYCSKLFMNKKIFEGLNMGRAMIRLSTMLRGTPICKYIIV